MSKHLLITQPDDWHLHLRDDNFLETTVNDAARQFRRAIIMPNLAVPITTAELAKAYYQRINHRIPSGKKFQPLMTIYLTDNTTPLIIEEAKASGIIFACKLYPMGSTTHSQHGVSDIKKLFPVFTKMAELNMPLLIHGEATDKDIDIFDREKYFIETILSSLIEQFPSLKIVLEHITTEDAVDFIVKASPNIAATITAHHLLLDRNAIFAGGINPHYYCLPILKRKKHQTALITAAISGNPKFFLGTDSAPHTIETKECAHGCAGIYSAHAALELYAEVFSEAQALNKLEAFASFYGSDFYGLPRNTNKISLVNEPWQVPAKIKFGNSELIPLWAEKSLQFKLCASQ